MEKHIIKCINCGADFKTSLLKAYSCPHCRTHYRITKRGMETVKPDRNDRKRIDKAKRRMIFDLKFEYRGKHWAYSILILICLLLLAAFICGKIYFELPTIALVMMSVMSLLCGSICCVSLYFELKKYRQDLHREIKNFHERFFIKRSRNEEVKLLNDEIEIRNKKCEKCGASVDINKRTDDGYFVCNFCGTKHAEIVENKNIPPKVRRRKMYRKHREFIVPLIGLGFFIILFTMLAIFTRKWELLIGTGMAGIMFALIFVGYYYSGVEYTGKSVSENQEEFDKVDSLGITFNRTEKKQDIEDKNKFNK